MKTIIAIQTSGNIEETTCCKFIKPLIESTESQTNKWKEVYSRLNQKDKQHPQFYLTESYVNSLNQYISPIFFINESV